MTSTIAPPAPPSGAVPDAHAVVRFAASLHGALDRLAEVPMWSMTPAEERAALVEIARAEARMAELKLRVYLQADRDGVGAESGATSTPAWLADATKTTSAGCHRDLHLARKLDETFPATRRALAAGVIDVEKATIVTAAVEALTAEYDDLPPGTEARAEAHMIDQAKAFDPPALRKLAKRLFEVVCPEAADEAEGRKLEKDEAKARALAHFSVRENGDGTSEGKFKLPTLHADLLKKALEALTSPRRIGEGRIDPETGKKLPHATLLGHGLMELIEGHLSDLPSVNGSPFTLVVTIGYDALLSGLGVGGHRHRAPDQRGRGTQVGVPGGDHPAGAGRGLDAAGRGPGAAVVRPAPEGRDQPPSTPGCAAHNCDRPPAWMEYHHEDPWHQGGHTDASNGISLCPPHHRMADHPQTYDMHRLPNGKVRFSRRQ